MAGIIVTVVLSIIGMIVVVHDTAPQIEWGTVVFVAILSLVAFAGGPLTKCVEWLFGKLVAWVLVTGTVTVMSGTLVADSRSTYPIFVIGAFAGRWIVGHLLSGGKDNGRPE